MSKSRYILMVGIILSLNQIQLKGQSFYLSANGEIAFTGIQEGNDDWIDLNSSEARQYFIDRGFGNFNQDVSSGFLMVQGVKQFGTSTYPRLNRVLMFENDVIIGFSDKLEFRRVSRSCIASPIKSTLPEGYQKSVDEDWRERSILLKEYKKSLGRDNLPTELWGSSDEDGFSYSSIIKQGRKNIKRSFSSTLDERACVYKFELLRTLTLNKQDYHVGDYDLSAVNQYDLNLMIKVFLEDCLLHGIKVPHSEVIVSMKTLKGNTIGLSFGMNDDSRIEMVVDPQKWSEASPPKRWYILYHELGHDVLNLEHGQAGKMMFNFADKGYSWEEFWRDKEYMLTNSVK